jgi:ribosomal protein L11 methyltransferase
MEWIEISVAADGEAGEAVSELFNRLNSRPDGQGGAVTEVSGFDPVGNEHRPIVTVRTYLPVGAPESTEQQRRIEEGLWFLGRIYPIGEPQVRQIAEEDWANAWKEHYHPFRVGRRFVVIPAWLWAGEIRESSPQTDPAGGHEADSPVEAIDLRFGDLPLILDPGMAFGTGLHPSTQLCLTAMEDVIGAGQRILDAGCGSGILSIAAARLGATVVEAFDIDSLAVQATGDNAALNDLPIPINIFASAGPDDAAPWVSPAAGPMRFDVILVNILLPVILELLDAGLARHLSPDGCMILAGVVADQGPQLSEALAFHHLRVVRRLQQGDWVAFLVGRQTA